MKLYSNFDAWDISQDLVVSIGMFDGVHIGHKKVIQTTVDLAKSRHLKSAIITFSNHPSDYFIPKHSEKLLTSPAEKISLIEQLGVDYIFMLPFDHYMANCSATHFVSDVLIQKLSCKTIVLGYDNHFGKNREGTIHFLHSYFSDKLEAISVEAAIINDQTVSSSLIKSKIADNDVVGANQLLGYSFELPGIVVEGNKLGRTIGFPTANLSLEDSNKLIPPTGVYESIVRINGLYLQGITNIGFRPTIENSSLIKIETHILNFDEDIYEHEIIIQPGRKIRNEIKFDSIDHLKRQIQFDLAQVHITP
jgi:riboflavin kinase/FMN adenylyltransferase